MIKSRGVFYSPYSTEGFFRVSLITEYTLRSQTKFLENIVMIEFIQADDSTTKERK